MSQWPVRPLLAAAALGAAAIAAAPWHSAPALAQHAIEDAITAVRHVKVTRNKSRTFELSRAFASAVVGSPDIADVLPVSDRVLYLQGKKAGTTNVSVFGTDKRIVAILEVEVTIDAQQVAEKIRANIEGKGITVSSNQEQLILAGYANSAVDAEQAAAIAKAIAPESQLVNLIKIAPAQQVLLKVRFIEASRDAERDLGVNWFASNSKQTQGVNIGSGAPTQIGQSPSAAPGGLPLFQAAGTLAGSSAAPFAVGLANLASKGANIDALISTLETKGLARRLAEPDLVALSGDKGRGPGAGSAALFGGHSHNHGGL